MTLKEALSEQARELKKKGITSACLEAEVLLPFVLNWTQEKFYLNLEKKITKNQIKKYKDLIKRRLDHEPLAYILGHQEFYGLDFYLNSDVLIPRPETELLIDEVLKCIRYQISSIRYQVSSIRYQASGIKIVDVGTGSGCIAISLAKQLEQFKQLKDYSLYATDISKKALAIAQKNAQRHKVEKKIKFLEGNLLEPLKSLSSLSNLLIVANLPYISQPEIKKLPPEIKNYEPSLAYDGGPDGLKYYQKLFSQIKKYLQGEGILFLEISPLILKSFKKLTKKYFPKTKLKIIKDYASLDRILKLEIKEN